VSELPPALLLDLDDTILCSTPGFEPAWRQVCERHAGSDAEALYSAIRRCADALWADAERAGWGRLDLPRAGREIVGEAFESLGRAVDTARVGTIVDEYRATRDANLAPFPGALDVVGEFRARGVGLALLTNGGAKPQRAKVERFGLDALFDVVLIEGELGVGKPERRVFELALGGLGVDAHDTWMVGDNLEADVGGAQAMGIHAIWHDYDRSGLPEDAPIRPDRIVHALRELL
jgi:putative hydrolase of the HAD superfamily